MCGFGTHTHTLNSIEWKYQILFGKYHKAQHAQCTVYAPPSIESNEQETERQININKWMEEQ